MSPEVREKLCEAGWYPGRAISTKDWVAQLALDGFVLIPEAERIISEFGGLTLTPQILPSTFAYARQSYFDPVQPGGQGDIDRVYDWEKRLGLTINPIGDYANGHQTLLYASDGRIFVASNGSLYLYGSTFEDALENTLVIARRPPRLIGHLSDNGE
ncbi:MAG: SUKH-3 domain-containing protein [Planctomycetes bacterium]|nr:SUKH-3 domain-containing protein [Planctomycetota bacterium]